MLARDAIGTTQLASGSGVRKWLGTGAVASGARTLWVVKGLRGKISLIDPRGRPTTSDRCCHGRLPQCESAQHVVGEREPQQHGAGFLLAPHVKLSEPHAARP